ncbi:MAG: endonuclease MutS2 [Planctomycetota bacterium]
MCELEDFAAERLDWPAVRRLFERLAGSPLGRRALSELRPRTPEDARRAQTCIAELLARTEAAGEPPLGDLFDPIPVVDEAARFGRAMSGDDLLGVLSFLNAIQRLGEWLEREREFLPVLSRTTADLPDLSALRRLLDDGLDARGNVRDEASPRLARTRERIRKTVQEIERAAKAIANRADLRAVIADGQAGRVHSRGGRMVIAVKAKASGRVRGIVHDHSQSGETAFVEPEGLVPLGNDLATARADEHREVARLLVEWTRAVLDRREGIGRAAGSLAELELSVIGTRFCRTYAARPLEHPAEGEPAVMLLRSVRHPLLAEQERSGELDHAVPIDLRLGDPFDVLVITGPNTGGKTLALKTAGLAALMARLGLPMPCAEGTRVPFYSAVSADIGDEQEVQQSLSTFSSHLARITEGLRRSDERTLFLLDELGGGTDPAEGAALGAALLEHLARRRVPTLASTHIGRLKEFAFSRARVENASVEFDAQTLRPLYRLIVGTPGESRALQIAERLGFDHTVLSDARRRLERPSEESARLMDDLRSAREQSERDRAAAEERLAAASARQAELERHAGELEVRAGALADEAQVQLEGQLREVRRGIEALRARAAQTPAPHRGALEALASQLEGALATGALTDARQSFVDGLKKGALVYVPRYRKRCPILRLDRDKGRVVVRLGKRELELTLDDISAFEQL